ncbi:MAG: acyltransferase family protein [Actinomycetota bacterium]|nr:acyltransferase family protein [Actinomycetota bacterium]
MAARRSASELLPEIEGLRGLAVVSVLLYHAGFGFSGGYVGVDVFFVLSGFLITRLLVRERNATGRISLAAFYARRARRLLPAATLVLLFTVVASYALLNPLRAHDTAVDARWAALFAANVHFARLGTDYLASSAAPSLLQHWWSLAIEEQFYLVWPGLLAAAWAVWRRVTAAVMTVCVAVVVGSFVVGIALTGSNPVWAYFAPWSRAWELALGGLCALVWPWRERIVGAAGLGWAGLFAVGASALVYDSSTAFPGSAALVPVVGTSAVILSIGATGAPGRVLSTAPLQWIGGRSYGIYLWHWPLLVLLAERYERTTPGWRAGALALSVVLAAFTYVLLENPLRHHPSLIRSTSRSLAVGSLMLGLVIVPAWWAETTTSDVRLSTGYVAATIAPTFPMSSLPVTGDPAGSTTTTVAPDPLALLEQKVAAELQPLIAASAQQDLVPDNITPSISQQAKDSPRVWGDGCLVEFFDDTSPVCEYGDLTSDTTVALFGDSHVDQWFPAAEEAAIRNHWKLLVISKSKCAIVDIDIVYEGTRPYPQCTEWRPDAMARVLAPEVKVVIITHWRQHYHVVDGGEARNVYDREWRDALGEAVSTLQNAGKKVLLLGDTPFARGPMDQCIVSHPRTLTSCNLDRPNHVVANAMELERDLAATLGADYYDTNQWFCAGDVCPVVIGNMAVYLDSHHINATYGLFLTPYLELLIQHLLTS